MKKEVDRLSIRKYVNFYEKVGNFLKTVKSGLLAALLRYDKLALQIRVCGARCKVLNFSK